MNHFATLPTGGTCLLSFCAVVLLVACGGKCLCAFWKNNCEKG